MKYYIEKDNLNRVVTKGTTSVDAVIEPPLIEVSEEEFDSIEQYMPPSEEALKEPTIEDYLIDLDFRISKIELGLEV
jgi:hypothetical protein